MNTRDVTTADRQVLVDTSDDGVGTITFHNPERRNAWNAGDVLPAAQACAAMLATGSSPRAMAAIRPQVWGDLSRGHTEANALWFEAMLRLNSPDNPDFAEGVNAVVAKRQPRFAPLPPDGDRPPLPPFAPQ
jgi:enoyl-CoA hydratase/carnithine racemase